MKPIVCLFLIAAICVPLHTAKAFNPETDIITYQKYSSAKQLRDASTLIGIGEAKNVINSFPTGHTVSQGQLVNDVQRIDIKRAIKGHTQTVSLLITGITPLPPPRDPINSVYPGPLASGQYIFFLQRIEGTPYYKLTGGWQGLYPLLQGKSVALQNEGFPQFHQLTVEQFIKTLNEQ